VWVLNKESPRSKQLAGKRDIMFKESIIDTENRLRVFMDTDCTEQLKVWYVDGKKMNQPDAVCEFRLLYNVIYDPHCIAWRKKDVDGKPEEIYAHTAIDDGEDKSVFDVDGNRISFAFKQAPTLILDGVFERKNLQALADDFLKRSGYIDQKLAQFIYQKLLGFPEGQYVSKPHI
jgi:hypothetical protein